MNQRASLRNRIVLKLRVGVQCNDDVTRRVREPQIECMRLAAVGDGNQLDTAIGPEAIAHQLRRAIARTIVHNDNLKDDMGACKDALNCRADHLLLVERGNDDTDFQGDGRGERIEELCCFAPPVPESERAENDKAGNPQCNRNEETIVQNGSEPTQREENHAVGEQGGRRRQTRIGLLAGNTCQLRYRHELVALRPQLIDEARQHRYCLGTIASGIVEQDHRSSRVRILRMNRRDDAANHYVCARQLPVNGVDANADRHVTEVLRDLNGFDFGFRCRRRISEIRWPEHTQRAPGQRLKKALRRVQLERYRGIRRIGEIGMRECVISYLVAFRENALHKARIGFRIAADDEERRRDVLRLQDIEDFRRVFRIRTIVEGERKLGLAVARLTNDERRRQLRIGFIIDVASILVDFDAARSRRRLCLHAQDFALPLEIDVLCGWDIAQCRG